MKGRQILLLSFITIVFIASCKKVESDYRKPYLGDFNFYVHYSSVVGPSPATFDTIEYNYVGEINMMGDSSILVPFPNEDTLEFYISSKGDVKYICSYNHQYNPVIGTSNGTNLSITFDDDTCVTGPLGANWEYKMTANR